MTKRTILLVGLLLVLAVSLGLPSSVSTQGPPFSVNPQQVYFGTVELGQDPVSFSAQITNLTDDYLELEAYPSQLINAQEPDGVPPWYWPQMLYLAPGETASVGMQVQHVVVGDFWVELGVESSDPYFYSPILAWGKWDWPTSTPPPEGTTTSGEPGDNGVPIVNWRDHMILTAEACPWGTVSYTFARGGTIIESDVMYETPYGSGTYMAIILPAWPLWGYAEVTLEVSCPDGSTSTYLFNIYLDPSGVVKTVTGDPMPGATVTLLHSESSSGPFEAVPSGSELMAPENRQNPDTTDDLGRYGWNVAAGYYKIRAEADGCFVPGDPSQPFIETGVLPVPPPVTELELVLECAAVPNEPPTADAGGPYLVAVGAQVPLDGTASDPDQNPLSFSWTAAAGTFDDPTLEDPTYAAGSEAGIYGLTFTASDGDLSASDAATVVVYDPAGGFVTGGGWIWSQAGWCQLDDVCSGTEGKANFGFVSKYQKGAGVPTGSTEFNFEAGGLNFHSDNYDWLLVTGSNYAMFKGSGTINQGPAPTGEAYKFKLWAGDGEPDTFRIKLWWEQGDTEHVVYDNSVDQSIGGGSVVIHTK